MTKLRSQSELWKATGDDSSGTRVSGNGVSINTSLKNELQPEALREELTEKDILLQNLEKQVKEASLLSWRTMNDKL